MGIRILTVGFSSSYSNWSRPLGMNGFNGYTIARSGYPFMMTVGSMASFGFGLTHAVVMEGIVSAILEQSEHTHLESYAGTFFSKRSGDEPDIVERQNAFLDDQIERYKDDKRRLYLLFEIISEFEPSRRAGRIATLVENNKDLKIFQSIKLKSSFRSWSGSAVPLVQADIDFYSSLLPTVRAPISGAVFCKAN